MFSISEIIFWKKWFKHDAGRLKTKIIPFPFSKMHANMYYVDRALKYLTIKTVVSTRQYLTKRT